MTHEELCKALLVERFAHPVPEWKPERVEESVLPSLPAWWLVHAFAQASKKAVA